MVVARASAGVTKPAATSASSGGRSYALANLMTASARGAFSPVFHRDTCGPLTPAASAIFWTGASGPERCFT